MSPSLLRRAFVDVCRGYSTGRLGGRAFCIRHLSHADHIAFDDLQARYEDEARQQGAPTEEQRLAYLAGRGEWSKAKDLDIERQRDFIARLEAGRNGIAVPSVLRSQDEQIARERETLAGMQRERAKVLGMTVEVYGQRRLEDYYLMRNLFADEGLREPLYPPDAFEDLSDEEVDAIYAAYRTAVEPCSDANLRRLAVADFFTAYYALCADNLYAFYGKPICDLTYYQVRLGNMARYMKGVLETTDLNKLAPAARADPDAIEQAHIMQRNQAALNAEGKTPTNMTQADMRELGIQGQMTKLPPTDLSGVELVKWLAKNQRRG